MSFYIYKTDFKKGIYNNGARVLNNKIVFENDNINKYYDDYNLLLFEPTIGSNNSDIREYAYFNGYNENSYIEIDFEIESEGYCSIITKYNYNGFLEIMFYENKIVLQEIRRNYKRTISYYDYYIPTNISTNIKVVASKLTYSIYVNGNYINMFSVNDTDYIIGFFGVSGYKSSVSNISINSSLPVDYIINGKCNVYMFDEDCSNFVISCYEDNNEDNYVYREINVQANQNYCVYIDYDGSGYVSIHDGINEFIINSNMQKITPLSDKITIKFVPTSTTLPFVVKSIQITDTDYFTLPLESGNSIVHTNKSLLYIPTNNNESNKINIKFDFELFDLYFDKNVIFATQDKNIIIYIDSDNKIYANINMSIFETGINIDDKINQIIINMRKTNDNVLEIKINNNNQLSEINVANYTYDFVVDYVYIGSINESGFNNLNASIREIKIVTDNIATYVFNGFIYDKANHNVVELWPKPKQYAPISVIFDDTGEELTRVSSFDFNTGEYVNTNKLIIEYDGSKKVYIGNYDVDTTYNYIIAESETGNIYRTEKFENGFAIFDIDDINNNNETGYEWTINYVINNSYCVMYRDDDTCQVILNCDPNRIVRISYESSNYDYSILYNCNLNPILNNNNVGFITINNEYEPVSYIDVYISNDTLNTAIEPYIFIYVDAYDKYNNIVENAELEVNAKYGSIINAANNGYIISQNEMSGRHVYIYIPPMTNKTLTTSYLLKDTITISEKSSNITTTKTINVII